MKINTLGLITYNYPHLKTEQVVQRLLRQDYRIKMYALPFIPRKARQVHIKHRPAQFDSIEPKIMAIKHDFEYIYCSNDREIDNSCDLYLILGAGILSSDCVAGKKIINCHPGIIPSSRGMDSFKWALYEMKPLGVTLHYIDAQVDAGEIISIVPTNVYTSDSLDTLARRHYENEIDCLSHFRECQNKRQNPFIGIEQCEAKRRMPIDIEKEMIGMFSQYVEKFGSVRN